MKMEAFDRLYFFYQNYRQRYTVIPITTVRGPLEKCPFTTTKSWKFTQHGKEQSGVGKYDDTSFIGDLSETVCHGQELRTTDHTRCEVFHNCTSIHNSSSCKYPDLFSDVSKTCEPFQRVNCGNRTIPLSPCKLVTQ